MGTEDKHVYYTAKVDSDSRCLREDFPETDTNFSVKEIIDREVTKASGRPTGGWIYPSSLGRCIRQVYYDAVSAEAQDIFKARTKKLMAYGTAIHETLQRILNNAEEIKEEFVDELPFRFKAFSVSGRLDGIFKCKDWLLEIKTIGKSSFTGLTSPREADLLQIHAYMYITDVPRSILYYVNRDSGDDMEFRVYFDKGHWEKLVAILSCVAEARRTGVPPPRLDNQFFCGECRYLQACMNNVG